ncbi:MAG: serine/threonine protein kinase [Myxococcota bacterium]|nr:serine/threonine protein kinase [Myxococcota bacterium]
MAESDPFGLMGQVLDGQFRVDRYVGEGGFSLVYRGTHLGLNEPIAIKFLKLPSALGSALVESFVLRFRDESRLHYKLSQGHLHIVRSMASGTTMASATGALVPYTVLEWLEGHSLAQEFAERHLRTQPLRTLGDVVKLFDSAIDAVAYAHAQGVVHRDLNPGNLFLTKTRAGVKLKVLDFGVAKVMADSALAMGPTARTLGNMRMFAPAYGAPEQFDDGVGPIGAWTDVYAIGLVLLEALTDRAVREGEHIGDFARQALDATWRPSPRALGLQVSDAVEDVFRAATSLVPGARPRDAGELWGMLKHAMSTGSGAAVAPALQAPVGALGGTLRMDQSGKGRPSQVPSPAALRTTPLPARGGVAVSIAPTLIDAPVLRSSAPAAPPRIIALWGIAFGVALVVAVVAWLIFSGRSC